MRTLDLDEAAALAKCHPDHLRKLAVNGQVPATKVGRSWVFVEELFHEWLLARCRKNVKHPK